MQGSLNSTSIKNSLSLSSVDVNKLITKARNTTTHSHKMNAALITIFNEATTNYVQKINLIFFLLRPINTRFYHFVKAKIKAKQNQQNFMPRRFKYL